MTKLIADLFVIVVASAIIVSILGSWSIIGMVSGDIGWAIALPILLWLASSVFRKQMRD